MLFRACCIPFWPNIDCASSLGYGHLPPPNGVPFVVGLEVSVGLGLGLAVEADGYRQVGAPLGRQLQTFLRGAYPAKGPVLYEASERGASYRSVVSQGA